MNPEEIRALIEDRHDSMVGETVDGEYMVVFRGWREIGQIVLAFNGLEPRTPEVEEKLRELGVQDIDDVLKNITEYGDTRIGRNGRSPRHDEPAYECILPDIDEIIDQAYGVAGTCWGFDDEYDRCSGCGLIVRTSPDCYSWTPSYLASDWGLYCNKCLADDPEFYIGAIKNTLMGDVSSIDIDIEEHGWVQVGEEYENGLYEHANDDPRKILKMLNEAGVDVIFRIHPSQFEVEFEVYVPEDQKEAAETILSGSSVKYPFGQSPADICKKGFQDASKKMAVIMASPDEVKVAKIKADGTADVRVVSGQDFIDGKALDD